MFGWQTFLSRRKLGQVNRNTFHSDGVTCAPGTPAGKVLCYDLRKSASPISKWEAKDREPVTCVRFEHLEAPSDASIGSEKAKSVQTHSNEAYKSSRELHSAVDEAVLNLARTKKKERSSESDVENDSLVNNSKHTGVSKTNGLKNKVRDAIPLHSASLLFNITYVFLSICSYSKGRQRPTLLDGMPS